MVNVPPNPCTAPAGPPDGSEPTGPPAPSAEQVAAEGLARERRQRLAEQIVAGMLPETTSDERLSGSDTSGLSEQWYRENRPPHHG